MSGAEDLLETDQSTEYLTSYTYACVRGTRTHWELRLFSVRVPRTEAQDLAPIKMNMTSTNATSLPTHKALRRDVAGNRLINRILNLLYLHII